MVFLCCFLMVKEVVGYRITVHFEEILAYVYTLVLTPRKNEVSYARDPNVEFGLLMSKSGLK